MFKSIVENFSKNKASRIVLKISPILYVFYSKHWIRELNLPLAKQIKISWFKITALEL